MLVWGIQKHGLFSFADADDGDLAYRYRLVCGAYADLKFDTARIPAELQAIVPIAAKYGHGNPLLLDDCISKLSPDHARELVSQIDAHRQSIEAWVGRFPPTFIAKEVSAFRELLLLRSRLKPASSTSDTSG